MRIMCRNACNFEIEKATDWAQRFIWKPIIITKHVVLRAGQLKMYTQGTKLMSGSLVTTIGRGERSFHPEMSRAVFWNFTYIVLSILNRLIE